MKNRIEPIREKTQWMNWALCMALFVVLESVFFIYRQYNTAWYMNMVLLQFSIPLTCAFAGIVLTQPAVRRHVDVLLAVGFALWYAVALLLNGHYFWIEYAQYMHLFYRLVLVMVICYPLAYALNSKGQLDIMRAVLGALTLVVVAIAALGIHRAVIRQPLVSPFNGAEMGLLLDGDGVSLRLFPMVHANTGGAIFMMALLLCVFLCLAAKRAWAKVLFAVAAVPVYVALALTNSRTSMVLAVFGLGLLGFLVVRKRMARTKPLLSWGIGILCAVAVTGVCFVGYKGAMWAVSQASRMEPVAAAQAESAPAEQAEPVQASSAEKAADPEYAIQQRELLAGAGTLNGRTEIWMKVLQGIAQQPKILLRGLTFERTEAFVTQLMQDHPHAHNAFLQTLLTAGLPGLLLLVGLVVCLIRFGLRLFLDVSEHTGLAQRFLPVVLLCSVAMAMVEVMFFSAQFVTDRLFFLTAGYVAVLARQLAEKKKEA